MLHYNPNKHIKGLHVRFLPEQTTEENISSREFLKKAEFINIDSLLKSDENENGGNSTGGENGGGTNTNNSNGTNSGNEDSVEAPVINGENPFAESTEVTIQGPQGAEVRYTTDGSTPTSESQLYSEAFTLTEATTIKAIAILNGVSSAVSTRAFTKSSGGSGGGSFDTGS